MSDRIEEILQRLRAATPGPWSHYSDKLRPQFSVRIHEIHGPRLKRIVTWPGFDGTDCGKKATAANAEFIAHAPEDIRWLVEEVKRLRERNTVMRRWIDEAQRKEFQKVVDLR